MSSSLRPHGLYSPWTSLGQNTRVGSLSLLQGIYPAQGLNPGLPHCRRILYQLGHKGSPDASKIQIILFICTHSRGFFAEGNGNPLRYSCLENSMDKGAWWLQSMWLQRVGHQSDYYSLKGFLGEYGPYAFYLCPLLLAEA